MSNLLELSIENISQRELNSVIHELFQLSSIKNVNNLIQSSNFSGDYLSLLEDEEMFSVFINYEKVFIDQFVIKEPSLQILKLNGTFEINFIFEEKMLHQMPQDFFQLFERIVRKICSKYNLSFKFGQEPIATCTSYIFAS